MKKPDFEIPVLKKIHRKKVYHITNLKNHKETISYLSHFYKRGVRIWVLSVGKNFTFELLKRHHFKQLYMRTIDYADLKRYKFEEIDPTDLPLHITNATPLMEKYLKEKYPKNN